MPNKFGIPEEELQKVHKRDQNCVYCHKKMIYPYSKKNHSASATIEHLNFDGPFYWNKGLKIEGIVMCCGRCNSSRGKKDLPSWFESNYCINHKINENTVSEVVQNYLKKSDRQPRQVIKNSQ